MPTFVQPRQKNPLFDALAGIASTASNASAQRQDRVLDHNVANSKIGLNDSQMQKALAEAAGLEITNNARRDAPQTFARTNSGIDGLEGENIGRAIQALGDNFNNDSIQQFRDNQFLTSASNNFDVDPSKAAFQANLGGAKVNNQFNQNESGQTLNNFSGKTDSSSPLTQSSINQNNARANQSNSAALLNNKKVQEFGEGGLSTIDQANLDLKQAQLGQINNENEAAARAKNHALDNAIFKAERTSKLVGDAQGLVDGKSSGIAAALTSRIPGFPAFDLSKKIQTINSNLGIDELLRIKAEGGTFGALSDRELTTLQTSIANLDQAQSPEQLTAQLQVIDDQYQRFIATARQERGDQSAPQPINQSGGEAISISSDEEFHSLPSGSQFIDPNGQMRVKP